MPDLQYNRTEYRAALAENRRLKAALQQAIATIAETDRLHTAALRADHPYPPKGRRNERIEVHARQRAQITLLQEENTRMGTKLTQAMNELSAAAARVKHLEHHILEKLRNQPRN